MTAQSAHCPVCDRSREVVELSHRQAVPILQNVIIADRRQAENFPQGKISICQCQECSFVWNKSFDAEIDLYGSSYNNDVSESNYYRSHLGRMANEVISHFKSKKEVNCVEIGCGDGSFVDYLRGGIGHKSISYVGFDPAYAGVNDGGSKDRVYREYFGPENRKKLPAGVDAFISRHTIEHIANPREFIKLIADAVENSDSKVFIETPNVDWITKNIAFYDFFYEHCSLFNKYSLSFLLEEFGFCGEVKEVYDGQYIWGCFSRSKNLNRLPQSLTERDVSLADADSFRRELHAFIEKWIEAVSTAKKFGRVGVWGAASKGVTFASMMAEKECGIDFAIDLNHQKQGCFMPQTAVKITSPEDVELSNSDTVIVMNPNYYHEIAEYLRECSLSPKILCF